MIRDAAELRVKESDRIAVMTDNLRRMGVDVEETEDGMIIHGGRPLHGAVIDPRLDHRVAMSFAVAGTGLRGNYGTFSTETASGFPILIFTKISTVWDDSARCGHTQCIKTKYYKEDLT